MPRRISLSGVLSANVMRVLADNTKREQDEIEYHRMAAEYEGLAMEIEKLNKRVVSRLKLRRMRTVKPKGKPKRS